MRGACSGRVRAWPVACRRRSRRGSAGAGRGVGGGCSSRGKRSQGSGQFGGVRYGAVALAATSSGSARKPFRILPQDLRVIRPAGGDHPAAQHPAGSSLNAVSSCPSPVACWCRWSPRSTGVILSAHSVTAVTIYTNKHRARARRDSVREEPAGAGLPVIASSPYHPQTCGRSNGSADPEEVAASPRPLPHPRRTEPGPWTASSHYYNHRPTPRPAPATPARPSAATPPARPATRPLPAPRIVRHLTVTTPDRSSSAATPCK